MNETDAYIALNMMEKVGPVGVRSLVEALGSARAVFEASREALESARGIGRQTAEAILSQRERIDWVVEQERARTMGLRILTPLDAEYPEELKSIHDPPLALYVRGTLLQRDRHAVAVVGTRRPTHYGRETTALFSEGLARCGFTVVSGLAEGVDTVAHETCLKAGGRTLAVLGGAMDCLYPASNHDLAERIAGCGAVLSEFPLGKRPDKTTFPMRNRLVSGLSVGVLVVEAGDKSGALITVNQALDQGRQVFAVPGRIDSNASRGTNGLIRQGATLVTGVEDVLRAFEFLPGGVLPAAAVRPAAAGVKAVLTTGEERIVEAIRMGEESVDGVIRRSGLPASEVGGLLIMLEMKRVVRMCPGRRLELSSAAAI